MKQLKPRQQPRHASTIRSGKGLFAERYCTICGEILTNKNRNKRCRGPR